MIRSPPHTHTARPTQQQRNASANHYYYYIELTVIFVATPKRERVGPATLVDGAAVVGRPHQQRVFPKTAALEGSGDVTDAFVHKFDHRRVLPAIDVVDKAQLVQEPCWGLEAVGPDARGVQRVVEVQRGGRRVRFDDAEGPGSEDGLLVAAVGPGAWK